MMSTYRVTCYATKVASAHTTVSALFTVVVEVTADTETQAREAAINAVYALRDDLEHVSPRKVEWLGESHD